MFRRRPSYYRSYKGRKSHSSKKLIWLSVILFIFLVIGAGFYFLAENIVFSADGISFRFQEDNPPPPSESSHEDEDDEDFEIIINDRPLKEDDVFTETAPAEAPRILGVRDGIENLLKKGYAAGLAKAAKERGCNTLCFEVKGPDGMMKVPLISSYSVQGSQSPKAGDIKSALLSLKKEGLHLAAEISVFSDNITPRSFRDNAVTASDSLWLDKDGVSRTDPFSPMASDYLCDVISSCAASGFDIIIMDELSFPSEGRTDIAEYKNAPEGADTFSAINAVMAKARDTANKEGVVLASVLSEKSIESEKTGQRVSDIARYCGAVFYKGQSDEALNASLSSAVSGTKCRIGVISTGAYSEPSGDISVISGYLK